MAIKHVLQRAELFGNRVIFDVTSIFYIFILAYFLLPVKCFFDQKEKNGKYFFFSFQIATNYAGEKFYNNTKRTAMRSPKRKD